MTSAQTKWYWQLVKAATAQYCRAHGLDRLPAKDATALRHQWHAEVFGRDVSSKNIGWGEDFDRIKAHLLALAKPDDLDAAIDVLADDDAGQRRRLLFKIDKWPADYTGAIVFSVTSGATRDPRELRTDQLVNLVRRLETNARRAREKRLATQVHHGDADAS